MHFGLSDDQIFFQDNVKKFLEDNAPLDIIKKISDGDDSSIKPCLLYTSPSPRDYAASRMPSSA